MGATQFSALTKKPYYGLNYDAIVRAKAASLPAAYAATEEKEYNQDVLQNARDNVAIQQQETDTAKAALDVEKQSKVAQLNYYNKASALSEEAMADEKSKATTASTLGLAGTGVGVYGAYKTGLLADNIAALSGESIAGVESTAGVGGATPLVESALTTVPESSPSLLAGAEALAPETASLATTTAAPIAAETVATDVGLGLDTTGAMISDSGSLTGVTAESLAGTSVGGAAAPGTGLYGLAGGTGVTPAFAYAGPAIAGYVAPKILDAVHEDSTENLGHNITLGLIKDEKTAATVGSGAAGAGAGILAGGLATSWTGPGMIVGAAIGGIVGAVSCFVPGTLIQMEDGSTKVIETLALGDIVKEGGMVIGCGKSFADNMYSYLGQILEGRHVTFEQGKWLRVENSPYAVKCVDMELTIVCPIVVQKHILIVNNHVYADLSETDQGWDVTDADRLNFLNSQKELNHRLASTYVN